MSHFTVLVPANNKSHLEEVLQPYHEYECTGKKDQYVIFVEADMEEAREEFEEYGSDYANFNDFMENWYGYELKNEVWGRWTNPNAKWDWWLIGGRWTGLLQLKNFEAMAFAGNGTPGLMTPTNENPLTADYAKSSDIDWQEMEQKDIDSRLKTYDAIHKVLSEFEGVTLEDFQQECFNFRGDASQWLEDYHNNDDPRSVYRKEVFPTNLDYVKWKAMEAETWKELHLFFSWKEIKTHLLPRDEFIKSFQARARTYAFIDLDGNWNQRGEMGWFGMDNKDKGTKDYNKIWWDFVRSLPDNQIVYIVDCHI